MPAQKYSLSGSLGQVLEVEHRERRRLGGGGRRARAAKLERDARSARAAGRRCRAAGRRRPWCRQRRSRSRSRGGVDAGSALQSGSRSRMRAITSDTVSPANACRPVRHSIQHAAERPDVGAPIDRLAARLLGAHVGRGAEDDARTWSRSSPRSARPRAGRTGARRRPSPLARPKSSTFTAPRRRQHDVARLEIAMDDAALVRGLDRRRDLPARPRASRAPAAGRARSAAPASRPRRTRAPGTARRPSPSSRP